MWPAVAAALYVAGSAMGIKGSIDAAEAESQAAEKDAAYKMLQADETQKRAAINMELVQEEGVVLGGEIGSAFAKGGVDVGSGSPLMVLAEAGYKTRRQMANIFTEAKFRADMIRAGAEDQKAWAGANRAAATTRAVASSLKVAGQAMSMSGGAKGGGDDGGMDEGTITSAAKKTPYKRNSGSTRNMSNIA
jgi:hypothetical protein